jgi:hypothetical protein
MRVTDTVEGWIRILRVSKSTSPRSSTPKLISPKCIYSSGRFFQPGPGVRSDQSPVLTAEALS